MYRVEFKGDWITQKTKLMAKFPALTDMDLTFAKGKKAEMLYNLERKLGVSSNQLRDLIESL